MREHTTAPGRSDAHRLFDVKMFRIITLLKFIIRRSNEPSHGPPGATALVQPMPRENYALMENRCVAESELNSSCGARRARDQGTKISISE
jgi:hypothetical protein